MSEFYNRYYPTVCIRRAEMKALEKLPDSEKAKMLPVVLLAPWLNSIEFQNTFQVVEKSIGATPVIADIDRNFRSASMLPSRTYFWSLLDTESGPENWMKLIKSHPTYIPVIQIRKMTDDGVNYQISEAEALGRGYAFRIDLSQEVDLDRIFGFIEGSINSDILIIFDYGYSEPGEEILSSLSKSISRLIEISEDAKFVISGSNFPNDFSDFDDFSSSKLIGARNVYQTLQGLYGNYNIFYGDWASTKPRRYDGHGNSPLPRIDFPTKFNWIIARSKENKWGFQEAAKRVTRLPEWDSRPIIWGTGMIEKTAEGLPGGISTNPQAMASRINIHLFLQNNFQTDTSGQAPEGKWVDPI